MGRLLEGFWDCKYCGTKGIGGSKRQCPNCGKARSDDTKFYLVNPQNRYVPEEKAAKINRNPDWICDYCGQLNSADDTNCVFCGASRTSENLDYFQYQEKQRQKEVEKEAQNSYESSFTEVEDSYDFSASRNQSRTTKISNFNIANFLAYASMPALAIILIVAFIFGIVYLFSPKVYDINVQQLLWERCINVERYQTVEENDWYLPSGARLIETRLEYSHSEQVLDHYETKTREVSKQEITGYETYVSGYRDLGNGYFEEITDTRPIYETVYYTESYEEPVYRYDPVYRTKYYYEIDKWLYERSVKTSGNDASPYWGETNLASDERTSAQSEKYMVKGINLKTDESISFSLSFEEWSSLNVGQNLQVEISFGHGKIIE